MAEKTTKKKIESMVIDELLDYEKALSLIIKYYAENIRIHNDNPLIVNEGQKKFLFYTNIRENVLNAIEDKLKELQ